VCLPKAGEPPVSATARLPCRRSGAMWSIARDHAVVVTSSRWRTDGRRSRDRVQDAVVLIEREPVVAARVAFLHYRPATGRRQLKG